MYIWLRLRPTMYRLFSRRQTVTTVVTLAILATIFSAQSTLAATKGASQSKKCQQYGHSCLGGHGKRSQQQQPLLQPQQSYNGLIHPIPSFHSNGRFSPVARSLPMSVPLYIMQEKAYGDYEPTDNDDISSRFTKSSEQTADQEQLDKLLEYWINTQHMEKEQQRQQHELEEPIKMAGKFNSKAPLVTPSDVAALNYIDRIHL